MTVVTNRKVSRPSRDEADRAELVLAPLGDVDIFGVKIGRRAGRIAWWLVLAVLLPLGALGTLVPLDVTVDAVGALEPGRVWSLRSRTSGVIEKVYVSAGDTVKSGAVLVALDSVASGMQVLQLAAQTSAGRGDLARARVFAPLDSAIADERVAITLAQVVRTQALLRARLVEFRLDGDIDSVLAAFVPGRHAALDEVVANVQTARAEYRGALTQLRRSRAESLDTLRLAAVVADHASRLAAGRIAHGQLNLRSPASGIVLTNEPERLVGEFVQPGQAVLEIASIEGWRAVLVLTAAQVALIRPSDAVVLEVPGLSGPVESRLTGRVSSISPQLEAKSDSRGYAVHVAIDGGWRPLGAAVDVRPGFAVKASIITRSATGLELLQSWLSRSVRRVRVSASDPLSR